LLYMADNEPVLIVLRGDDELNEVKLQNYLQAGELEFATEEETKQTLGTLPGFVGPIGIEKDIRIIADNRVLTMVNAIAGANKENYHFENVNLNRDWQADETTDLRLVKEGELSPDGQGVLKFTKGIEIGHIFKLGTRYS